MYSDNGTNFGGARNELHALYAYLRENNREIVDATRDAGIQWHFSPPRAPHFGGLWEAGVKSFKFHLKRVTGESKLSYESFQTLLLQVEAILNSRPITPLSNDPNDLTPLTPAHFLIGHKLTSLANDDLSEIPDSRVDKFQALQAMIHGFWKQWSKDYLNQQVQRRKWTTDSKETPFEIGQMIILRKDDSSPGWLLGRISELHPGNDGITRVVTTKTAHGTFKRPVSKIAVLPVNGIAS